MFSAVFTKTAENIETFVWPLSFNLSDPFLCGLPELVFVRLVSSVSTKTPENIETFARPLSFNLSDQFLAGCGQNWYLFAWFLLFPRRHQKTSKHSCGHFRSTCPIRFSRAAARTGICSLVFCCFHENTRKHENTRAATFVQPVRSVSRGLRPELVVVRLFFASAAQAMLMIVSEARCGNPKRFFTSKANTLASLA